MMTKKGFTLIEIVVVVSIMLIVTSIVVLAFSRFNKIMILNKDARMIVSLLNKARSDTISSRNDTQYGVHFETGKVVLFSGNIYSANSPTNQVIRLQPFVVVNSIALSGGGSNILFDRLTGKTAQAGNIVIVLVGSPTDVRQITVSGNGIVQ